MARVRWESPEPVYRFVIGLVLTVFKIMRWPIRVFGAQHVPATGAFVMASNHIGYLDFVFVGLAARERGRLVRFLAKQSIFDHPAWGPLMRAMKHIPVDRYGGRARDALEEGVDRLRQGQVVGMFPEATISPSFVPRPGKLGAARMAMQAQVPLLPVAVWGTQRILTKWRPRNFQRGVAIDIRVGPAVPYAPDDDPGDVTRRLMQAIRDLVDEAVADYPQQPAHDRDRWWLPAHLGGTAPTPAQAEARLARQRAEQGAREDDAA